MRALETIICYNCGKEVTKDKSEINRQRKRGRTKFYCNLTCFAIKSNEETKRPGNPRNLIANNLRDEHTEFRFFIKVGKCRDKESNRATNITTEYLSLLWEQQNGKCPFTGWKLILPYNCDGWLEKSPYNASLDRLDNDIGYVIGNVRFISLIANYARHLFSDDDVINFCKAVTDKTEQNQLLSGRGGS